jgi:hypothetical protein
LFLLNLGESLEVLPGLDGWPLSAITTAFNGIAKQAGLPKFRVYDCRVQAITKLLSNPDVSPQVSNEIAGHISQAMQNHYSIQQFDTKMAALTTLETPPAAPVPPEPIAPAQELAPPLDATQTAIQTEIAREVDRKVALALQEYFASRPSAEIPKPKKLAG